MTDSGRLQFEQRKQRLLFSPFRLTLVLVVCTFFIELLIMFLLDNVPKLSPVQEALVDSFLLSFALSPVFIFVLFRPLRRLVAQYRDNERLLRGRKESLKEQVRERTSALADVVQQLREEINERQKSEAERLEFRAQLHQVQKIESVGKLAGGIAHDYNNMLSVIIGNVELAQMKVEPTDPLREDLDEIFAAANRSREITRQLLAFARKQIIAPQVLDLNAVVEGTLRMLRQLLGENIDLVWRPKAGLWPIEIDPSQLDQILANLCVNARDAITDVGKMTIETGMVSLDQAYCRDHLGFSPGDFLVLAVSDNGCGMDKATLERIFEPFFTTKQDGKGTGLGLATVYGTVKQSKGFINVYSEPGNGTTFKIYLPRYAGPLAAVQATIEPEILKGRGETIMVVEDEPSILKLTTTMLSDLGYRLLMAQSPADALALVIAHPGEIDLLITDVVMPGMNGRQLTERLRCDYPQLKCLYMSGYTADVIAHHGVLERDVSFIHKPFSRSELSLQVRKILDAEHNDSSVRFV